MNAVDSYLEKERGVHDESKHLTAYQKEMRGKELKKAQKKAAAASSTAAAEDKRAAHAMARDDARKAARAGMQVLAEEDEGDVRANKANTAFL
jgi:ribosomal protein L12E/L44/L45/RPP1/RPP2